MTTIWEKKIKQKQKKVGSKWKEESFHFGKQYG